MQEKDSHTFLAFVLKLSTPTNAIKESFLSHGCLWFGGKMSARQTGYNIILIVAAVQCYYCFSRLAINE